MKKPPKRPARPLQSSRPERELREPSDAQIARVIGKLHLPDDAQLVREARAELAQASPVAQCVQRTLLAIEELSESLPHAERIEVYEQLRADLSIWIEAERDDMRNKAGQ